MDQMVLAWYQLVHLDPKADLLQKRLEAAEKVVTAVDESEDWDLIRELVVLVLFGYSDFQPCDDASQVLTKAILESDTDAIDSELSELELRALAGIAITLIVSSSAKFHTEQTGTALLIVAAEGLRSLPKQKFLRANIEKLIRAAVTTSMRAGKKRRDIGKPTTLTAEMMKDAAAGWATVASNHNLMIRRSTIDREEIDILWWFFDVTSDNRSDGLSELPIGRIVAATAADVSRISLIPPMESLGDILVRAISQIKNKKVGRKVTLGQLLGDLQREDMLKLVPADEASIASENPLLLPLSWMIARSTDEASKVDLDDFEAATGVSSKAERLPAEWAMQLLLEAVARRTLNGELGGAQ